MPVYVVGEKIEAFCKKCEVVSSHVIRVVKSNRLSRCACSVCDDLHPYRKGPPKAAADRKASKVEKALAEAAANFEEAMADRDPEDALAYSIREAFSAGDLIAHKSFGQGLVMRTLPDGKLEALFSEGTKILVHGRA